MILREHFIHHDRMKPYCKSPMLMLGNQENHLRYDFGVPYVTLDPDGGDYVYDLNKLQTPSTLYNTVYNLSSSLSVS